MTMVASWESLWPYRAVLAVDARSFSANTSKVQGEINQDIQQLLAAALADSALSGQWERRWFAQHTGDGYVAGLPPECLPGLVGCFPDALHYRLSEWRREHPNQTPLQLRVSIHVGPLPLTGLGVPMVDTHRLLDANGARQILAKANPSITTTAVIVSDRVYDDVFKSGCTTGDVQPDHFARGIVRVKTFEQPAWFLVPGLDWNLVDRSLIEEMPQPTTDAADGEAEPSTSADPDIQFNQYGAQGTQGYNVTNTYGVAR
jgi:hypothetical protein